MNILIKYYIYIYNKYSDEIHIYIYYYLYIVEKRYKIIVKVNL